MNPFSYFLRLFFHLLYHPFAWSYDLVAATVSLGRWQDWVRTVLPFVEGTHILEIGHGPGHLQRDLLNRDLHAVGLDESLHMGHLAKRNLSHNGYTRPSLLRGLAQFLPYPDETFDSVISTFPSNYIFDPETLLEVRRTLKTGGRLIVLPVAWIVGKTFLERSAAALFRATGQAPSDPVEIVKERLKQPFADTGFETKIEQVEVKSSLVLIVIAQKL